MPVQEYRKAPEFPRLGSFHNAYEMLRLKYEDAGRELSEGEYARMRDESTCSACMEYEPCECERCGVCDAVTGSRWLYDRDMHRVEVYERERPQVCSDNPACEFFEPTYTAIEKWRGR